MHVLDTDVAVVRLARVTRARTAADRERAVVDGDAGGAFGLTTPERASVLSSRVAATAAVG
jgi:hypothetical protein